MTTVKEIVSLEVGAALTELRIAKGWSQTRLAKTVGIDRSHISRVESGHRYLSLDTLEKIVSALEAELTLVIKLGPGGPYAAVEARSIGSAE